MEEYLKPLLSGAGFAGALLVYFFVRIEPRLRSMEMTILRSTRADLLRIAAISTIHPQLKEAAQTMIKEIDDDLEVK